MYRKELQRRTNQFAEYCIKKSVTLAKEPFGEYVRRHLIDCCGRIDSSFETACRARSGQGFAFQLEIVIEKTCECLFWWHLAIDEKLIEEETISPLLDEANELRDLFLASRKALIASS